MPTKIEWVRCPDGTQGETWNPIVGCSHASAGCKNCYAEEVAATRLLYHPLYDGLTSDGKWTGETRLSEKKLEAPLHWRKPRGIFVCSMGDLFHESVPFEWVAKVLGVAAVCQQHTFMSLTKRPDREREFFEWLDLRRRGYWQGHCGCLADTIVGGLISGDELARRWDDGRPPPESLGDSSTYNPGWPLPNLWPGVSVEDQDHAWRVAELQEIPAAVRFVSIEPMLGPVDLWGALGDGMIRWVIAGAETGPGKRPMDLDWARSARDQCAAAGVPFFFKVDSDGNHELDGIKHEELPR